MPAADLRRSRPIETWSYADAAERDAATYTAADIGLVARVASPLGFWRLSAVSPALAWEQIGGGGSSGGTKTISAFSALDSHPPASGFAAFDTRNSVGVMSFAKAENQSADFVGIVPEGADLSAGLNVRLYTMAATATSGNARWRVQVERWGTDLDANSFDTAAEANGAASSTSGVETVVSITLTTIDSLEPGDRYRLRVTRVVTDTTNDTMSGAAQLTAVEVRSAA